MRSVSFFEKFTSGSRIKASRSDLLKLPISKKRTVKGLIFCGKAGLWNQIPCVVFVAYTKGN